MNKRMVAAGLMLIVAVGVSAQQLSLVAESGFLSVLSHRIRYGAEERNFYYQRDGGQDTLFPFVRLSVEADIGDRRTVLFLYQPLELETQVEFDNPRLIDGKPFPAGRSVRVFYGFPFYRLSYLYALRRRSLWELEVGGGLQIRNATIEFEDSDGDPFLSRRDVGPVPLLKVRGVYRPTDSLWVGAEIDGIYAPVSYLNGSTNDVVGAFLDASLRVGYAVDRGLEPFLNLRYIGGGATNKDTGNYVENWLNFLFVSLGVTARSR